MSDEFDKAVDEVRKIVGKQFNAPKLQANITALNKVIDQFDKAIKPFTAARGALEKTILALQNTNSAYINQIKQLDNALAKETFGLDPDKPDEEKKIDQCTKLLGQAVAAMQKEAVTQNRQLDELDKHIEDIPDYKSPS